MASEQMPRRENNDRVVEREVHVETQKKKSLADKGRDQRGSEKKEKERELVSDRARPENKAKDKEVEEGRRGREGGGVQHVRKFETKDEVNKGFGGKAELERRTRVVVGRECNKEENLRSNRPRGTVEAEKGRPLEKTREETKGRDKAQIKEGGAEECRQVRESGGVVQRVVKFGTKGEAKRGSVEKEVERRTREVEGREWKKEEKQRSSPRGKVEAEKAGPEEAKPKGRENAETKQGGGEEQGRGREENDQLSLEEISKYRAEARQNSFDAIEAAKEKYERAKQEASEAAKERNKQANEEAAKETYERARQEASEAVKERNKQANEAIKAKDFNREKSQQVNVKAEGETEDKGYGEAKDTIINVDHTTSEALAFTTAQYLGEKAAQAKDATVETCKSAAKVAADLKDQAIVTGWNAAHYSTEMTEMTVEGAKAATNVVKGAAEYAGQKASELAAKSVDNAKEYTGRKKMEAEKDLAAKRESQNQESKERPSAKATTESFQIGQGQQNQEHGGEWEHVDAQERNQCGVGEREQKPLGNIIGETLGSAAQTIKKPLNKAAEGGREVLGAVGETVVEIGESIAKPAQKVQHQGEGGGVLNAIGETIAEIAETTKVIVAGEGAETTEVVLGGEGKREIIESYEYAERDLKLD
ncbi:hypothetical protein VNO78_06177 [Psophocarpus tetragonolobus]|uniref:Seed biotin-containing protein SBP65 n=1 Tax=Psophocarpus tetragonolobus TaxID=3891 RepID=A0AAN9SSS2_PSOTE